MPSGIATPANSATAAGAAVPPRFIALRPVHTVRDVRGGLPVRIRDRETALPRERDSRDHCADRTEDHKISDLCTGRRTTDASVPQIAQGQEPSADVVSPGGAARGAPEAASPFYFAGK